jgi:hypothetical protein
MEHIAPLSNVRSILLAALAILLASTGQLQAQEDLLSLDSVPEVSVPIKEAFNGSYVINNHSSNVLEGGRLNFLILHRFGEVKDGSYNAFGLDYAAMRLGFEYGLADELTIGIGRTSAGKNFDGYFKYRFLTQRLGGSSSFPLSVVLFSSAAFSSVELRRQNSIHDENQFTNQLVYTTELIMSRQFSDVFSIEIVPALVKRNSVSVAEHDHNVYALSGGARLKLTERMHLMADYSYVFNNNDKSLVNPLALGFDIVTGGHTFQFYATNSLGMIEKEFLTATTGNVKEGGIRLGFTVSRAFILKPKVEGGKLK